MNLRSLRFRITSLAMVVVMVVLLVTGIVLLRAVNSHLLGQVDEGLINNATYSEARLIGHQPESATVPAGELGQLLFANGALIGSSTNLKGQPPLIAVRGLASSRRLTTIYSPRLGHVRLLEEHFPAGSHLVVFARGRAVVVSGSDLVLVSGQEINQIVAADNSLTILLIIVLPILALGLAALIWIVVGRAMRRVELVRSKVAEISVHRLDARVPSTRSGDELDRLVETMNGMLDRLQGAVERERQFVADASHELRSPIAALRVALETDDGGRNELALTQMQRLDLLADELLALDSIDGQRSRPPPELVDLDELVLSLVDQFRQHSSLDLDTSGVSGGQVMAREVDMMRIVENLSSNAMRHAASRVVFSVTEDDDNVVFSVLDDGPGIPEAMRREVFARFTRIEPDRAHTVGGSGLGLAIVSELVRRYAGDVWVEGATPHGARFVVQLPGARCSGLARQSVTSQPHPA